MQGITCTGTSYKLKKMFGLIWEMGRHMEMMPGMSMTLAMCFPELRFFSDGSLDMLCWCCDNTM